MKRVNFVYGLDVRDYFKSRNEMSVYDDMITRVQLTTDELDRNRYLSTYFLVQNKDSFLAWRSSSKFQIVGVSDFNNFQWLPVGILPRPLLVFGTWLMSHKSSSWAQGLLKAESRSDLFGYGSQLQKTIDTGWPYIVFLSQFPTDAPSHRTSDYSPIKLVRMAGFVE